MDMDDLDRLRGVCMTNFIPVVCRFFKEEFQVEITEKECFVTDSSQLGKKFSMHIVVSSANNHIFQTREDSFTAMVMLSKYVEEATRVDPEFHEWMFYLNERNIKKSIWDFSVYDRSQRNMRMLGCCKASGQPEGTPWRKCRVFQPYNNASADAIKFVGSIMPGDDYTLLQVSDDMKQRAREYSCGLERDAWNNKKKYYRAYAVSGRAVSGKRGNVRFRGGAVDPALFELKQSIRKLREQNPSGIPDEELRRKCSEGKLAAEEFLTRAGIFLTSVVTAIHPGPASVHDVAEDGDVILEHQGRRHVDEEFQGVVGPKFCYFGCSSGSHFCVVSLRADFSVKYFCHGAVTALHTLRVSGSETLWGRRSVNGMS